MRNVQGWLSLIEFSVQDAKKVLPPEELSTGMLISNPPYGERLGGFSDTISLYTELGHHFKDAFAGWNLSMFAMDTELLSCLGMRAARSFKFFNGPIECVLKNYRISPKRTVEGAAVVEEKSTKVAKPKSLETTEFVESTEDNPWGTLPPVVEAEADIIFKEVKQIKPAIYAEDFANRLLKNMKRLDKWAKRENVQCYRLYDADLPEYNVAIDRYNEYLIITEYRAPKEIDAQKVRRRFLDIVSTTRYLLDLTDDQLIIKVRERQKGRQQYEKLDSKKQRLVVQEGPAKIIVNLTRLFRYWFIFRSSSNAFTYW